MSEAFQKLQDKMKRVRAMKQWLEDNDVDYHMPERSNGYCVVFPDGESIYRNDFIDFGYAVAKKLGKECNV